jgi:hypothetical protein
MDQQPVGLIDRWNAYWWRFARETHNGSRAPTSQALTSTGWFVTLLGGGWDALGSFMIVVGLLSYLVAWVAEWLERKLDRYFEWACVRRAERDAFTRHRPG